MPDRALDDLRVVDISQGIAGPYATKLLADSGALVTKVEPPAGDYTRRLGPFPGDVPDPEKSGLYLHLNTSKRSVTLDVSVTSGQVVLKKLLANADVFVTGDKTSTLRDWKLTYDDLRADFPDLIVAQVSPFGGTGPYAGYEGNSLTALALSSLMYNTGEPDREPLATGGNPGEYIAGIQLWLGILAAVENRAVNGGGDHVDVSMAEAAAAADEYNSAMYAFQGAVRRRYYSRHIFGYPNDIVKASDGYLVMIPGAGGFPSPMQQPGVVSPMALLMEDPELDESPFFKQGHERMINWQEFDKAIEPYLSSHTVDEIVSLAQALRMPFAPVPDAKDLLDDDHLRERKFFQQVSTPAGDVRLPGAPFIMSGTPLTEAPAPRRGEANEQVLADELGYSKDDLRIMSDRGVI
ncbi:MAG TPA: CoA transferase [Dehalococcoidia bacterium]|nr:CoA transferase [Dehalococcoidia bacterium]